MAYYSLLAVTPTAEDWIPDYIGLANAPVAKHGGKYLARTATNEQIEGEKQHGPLRIVISWPSRDAALAFLNDPEYVPHLKARTAGPESFHFLIEAKSKQQ